MLCADGTIEFRTAYGSCSGTVNDNLCFLYFLSCHFERVLQSCRRNDGCAMLVVVHHRYVEGFLQALFNVETLRRLNVFEVYATERRGYSLHSLTEFHWVCLVHLYIEDINAAVDLKQQSLALHDGLTAHGTDIAESEHCRTITDNSHKVAFVCVFVHIVRSLLDFQTWICHSW